MLNEHTLDQLRSLRLDGMVRAIEEQATGTAAAGLSFDERLTLLVQREVAWRDDRRVARLLKAAKLKVSAACIEDINWRASRGLDRHQITALAGCDLLTISPDLLSALAASEAALPKVLDAEAAKAMDIPFVQYDEAGFRFAMNEDAMATEKLAEGIRAFVVDTIKLEGMMR